LIIDSHAHYAHNRFNNEFPSICESDEGYDIINTDLESLFLQMKENGIVGTIEASIGFDDLGKQLKLTEEHRDYMWHSIGVHPTRCIRTKWRNRREVSRLAKESSPVAIGETGLDYHYPRCEQHRFLQKLWFVYHIKLAYHLNLPLILHIRDADHDALKILTKYKKMLHGGVVHCFSGDMSSAKEYIALGFSLGIGGKLLLNDEKGKELCEIVSNIPIGSLMVETDAPFVLPDIKDISCSRNQRRRLCNSSLILPSVIRKIAELHGVSCATVEELIFKNTVETFSLLPMHFQNVQKTTNLSLS